MSMADTVAVVTDGRFSGGTSGLSIGYISPEAAVGGPLNAVQDGDRVTIDIPKRKIDIQVPEAEIKTRQAQVDWHFNAAGYSRFLRLFARNVSSTAKGATWV